MRAGGCVSAGPVRRRTGAIVSSKGFVFFGGGRNWDSDKIGQKLGFVWENREDAKDQQQKADLIRRIGWWPAGDRLVSARKWVRLGSSRIVWGCPMEMWDMTSKEIDHSISPTKPAISSKRTKKNKDCNRSFAFESFLLRAQSLQTETLKTLPMLTVWRGKRTQKKLNPEYPDLGSFHWNLSNPWLIHGLRGFMASTYGSDVQRCSFCQTQAVVQLPTPFHPELQEGPDIAGPILSGKVDENDTETIWNYMKLFSIV